MSHILKSVSKTIHITIYSCDSHILICWVFSETIFYDLTHRKILDHVPTNSINFCDSTFKCFFTNLLLPKSTIKSKNEFFTAQK